MERGTRRTAQTVGVRAEKHGSLPGGSRRHRTGARSDAETADRGHECPVCGYEIGGQSGVYLHLQVDHRKSELARALLDTDG